MNKKIYAIALVIIALPLTAQWSEQIRITNTDTRSEMQKSGGGWSIAVDDQVHITWHELTESIDQLGVYYASFPVGSPPIPGAGQQVHSEGRDPVLASNGSSIQFDFHTISGNEYSCVFRDYYNGIWGDVRMNAHEARDPSIVVDDAGVAHFALTPYEVGETNRGVYYQCRDTITGWFSDTFRVDDTPQGEASVSPTICFGPTGTIYIAWIELWGTRDVSVVYSTDNGQTWSAPQTVASGAGGSLSTRRYSCKICTDSDDNYYVTFRDDDAYQIYVASNAPGFGDPVNVSMSPYWSDRWSSICCDAFDNLWVFWTGGGGEEDEIFYNRMDAVTGEWDGPQALTEDDFARSTTPHVAADKQGGVHVAWIDYRDGNGEIYYTWISALDLAIVDVLRPYDEEPADQVFQPACVVHNNLGSDIQAKLTCKIRDVSNNEIVYQDLLSACQLKPGYTDVSFTEFLPQPDMTYRAQFLVEHESDKDHTNNDMDKSFTTPPEDPTEISDCVASSSPELSVINPISGSGAVQFSVDNSTYVDLRIIDISGRTVEILADDCYVKGTYRLSYDAVNLSPGFYFVCLYTGDRHETARIVIIE